jgi:CAI-1 autoinducer synthase
MRRREHAVSTASCRVERFYRDRFHGTWGGRDLFHGAPPGGDAIGLQSNDYLDLARDPRIIQAQVAALGEFGNGALMSGVMVQDQADPLRVLEDRLAAHLSSDAVVLCHSGWAANVGLLQTIAGPDDTVYLDNIAHMSLREGARTAGAQLRSFRHNTPEDLEARVRRDGPGIVVVDSIYSTNGSVCPLADVVQIVGEHGCVLVVDESHSLGTHGSRGTGLVAELGLTSSVDFLTASLAKAFVGRAGLITCPRDFSRYFRYTSPPAVFSSVLLPHDVAGLDAALTVIQGAQVRRARLHQIAARVRDGLSGVGIDLDGCASQIIAISAGSELSAGRLRDALEQRGVFGSLFAPPATSPSRTLIRLSLHAGLSDPQVDRIISVCQAVAPRCGNASTRAVGE